MPICFVELTTDIERDFNVTTKCPRIERLTRGDALRISLAAMKPTPKGRSGTFQVEELEIGHRGSYGDLPKYCRRVSSVGDVGRPCSFSGMRLVLRLEESWQSRAYEDCILDMGSGGCVMRHGHYKPYPVHSEYVARTVDSKRESVPCHYMTESSPMHLEMGGEGIEKGNERGEGGQGDELVDTDYEHIEGDNEGQCDESGIDEGENARDSDCSESSEDEEIDVVDNDGDLDEKKDSDNGQDEGPSHPLFNVKETYDPTFEIGMLFSNKKEFKKALQSHAIKTKRTLKFTKNDKRRVYTEYGDADCEWSELSTCDMLLNNVCEIFNTCILDAREKSILTILEWIREYLTRRMQENRDRSQHSVDLGSKSCSCRKWQLSSIPCKHACFAIYYEKQVPIDYVHECYSVETYKKVSAPAIQLISHEGMWYESCIILPLPPNFRRGAGRPKKARRRESDEPTIKKKKKSKTPQVYKLRRNQKTVHCNTCGETGHNTAKCPEKVSNESQ
ncbi:UNVERIFIED_CONTAM: hypothetical protein Scaly_2766500 [Sesamum calycinum]|uniref:SWIM-type domain-containing protein n=1 Tax=Sesamum calycinum TaxID=2727403 RepID=A0AAW2IYI3_9LAMI